jgi:lysophospholipase L1-like esterase
MVNAGFGRALVERLKAAGATVTVTSVPSSTSKWWNTGTRVQDLLDKSDANVVVVVLGSNEVLLLKPQKTEPEIQGIVQKLGDRRCVWAGPPVWSYQTGVVELERKNSAPCGFFDASHLKLARQEDGIHPNHAGGRAWAAALWQAHFK